MTTNLLFQITVAYTSVALTTSIQQWLRDKRSRNFWQHQKMIDVLLRNTTTPIILGAIGSGKTVCAVNYIEQQIQRANQTKTP